MVPALTIIINNSLNQCTFPTLYEEALVTPIYKKGDPSSPGNYRPISSLPILSKVFEKILSSQLTNHFETNQLLSSHQFGFRKNTSSEHMLLYFTDKLREALDNNSPCHIATLSLDIKKAFDSVHHSLLLNKLEHLFYLSHPMLSLLSSYLTDRTQIMKIANTLSAPKSITKGVPQGSILGLLLFNTMINDLLTTYPTTLSYADDTNIYFISDTPTSAIQGIQSAFSAVQAWYTSNGFSLNVGKTTCMLFSNRNHPHPADLTLLNETIPISSELPLLGVVLDPRLTMKSHITKLVSKSSSLLYFLRKARPLLTTPQATTIYCSYIRPILEYCSTLLVKLPKQSISTIEHIQNNAIRIICKAPLPSRFRLLMPVSLSASPRWNIGGNVDLHLWSNRSWPILHLLYHSCLVRAIPTTDTYAPPAPTFSPQSLPTLAGYASLSWPSNIKSLGSKRTHHP